MHCDLGLSGKALAETVLGQLFDLGLDIRNRRGQGSDGAGTVSGYINWLNFLFFQVFSALKKDFNPLDLIQFRNMHQILKKRSCLISALLDGLKK